MRKEPLLLLVFAASAFAGAAGPFPDPLWSASPNGIARIAFDIGGTKSDYASAAAITAAGGLILGGDVAVAGDSGFGGTNDYSRIAFARMLGDGSNDASFDHYLVTAYPQSNNGVIVTDLAALSGGGAIFIGQSYHNAVRSPTIIGRLTDAGALDTNFNGQGYRLISGSALTGNLASVTAPERVRVQPDGKLLAIVNAGTTTAPLNYCVGVVRLTTSGAFDSEFGGGTGTVCYAPATATPVAAASDLALLSDGSILVAGEATHIGGSGFDMAVTRLAPGGALDTTFGTDGWAFVAFDQGGQLNDVAFAIAVDESGRIVLSGFFENGNGYGSAVVRLLANGSPDDSFGAQGKVVLHFDTDGDQVDDSSSGSDVHLLAGGRILFGGNTTPGNAVGGYAFAAMLRSDGSLDPDFGTGGTFLQANSMTADADVIRATRVLVNGDYLYFTGNSKATDNYDFAALRMIVPLFGNGFD